MKKRKKKKTRRDEKRREEKKIDTMRIEKREGRNIGEKKISYGRLVYHII